MTLSPNRPPKPRSEQPRRIVVPREQGAARVLNQVHGSQWVTLPYPPQVNHLYTVARGRKVLSKVGREYKARALAEALAQGVRPTGGECCVIVKLYRPRRAGDLDNFLKVTLDALTGVAWHDDSQVRIIHAERFDDKERPRVEVGISPIAA